MRAEGGHAPAEAARLPHFHMYAFVPNRLGPAMLIGDQPAEDATIVEAISGG